VPPRRPRFNAPAFLWFILVGHGYAFLGGLMLDQFYDEAAGHLPT